MFNLFRSQKAANTVQNSTAPPGFEAWVFWPSGERERFVVDPSRLNPKAMAGAENLLTGLSISGSIVRASLATGRTQTLTSCVPSPATGIENGGRPLAVRIAGDGGALLAVVAVYGGRHDAAAVKAALKLISDEAKLGLKEIESILSKSATPSGMVIATFGSKTDAAVDEAYGLALHLGAAMNGSALDAVAGPAAAPQAVSAATPLPGAGNLSMDEVTLEQLAILHQRSALILCGFAQGSREQAQAWDDWLEKYRLPSYEEGMKLLAQAGAPDVVVVNLLIDKGFWGELRTMPFRFAAIHGTMAGYAIPWEADNVPDIIDFPPPDPSKGPKQAAAAAIIGKVERLAR
jgi:hypothetical protein